MSDTPALAIMSTRPPRRRGRARSGRFVRSPAGIVGVGLTAGTVLVALLAPVLAPGDPFATVAEPFLAPSAGHPMGTDDLGRDLLRAVVHGARTSMVVVVSVVVVSSVIGIVVGVVAGYRGGLFDDVLMRVTEMFQAVPRFFLAILAVALLGAGLGNVILVLAVTSWPWLARVVRAETMSVKGRDFVAAATTMGVRDRTIVIRHVLPNVAPSILVVVTLTAARVILLEASLGFLGLGDPNAMSWGYLADNAQRFLRTAWWMSFFPGLAILAAVLGFTLLGDAIVDAREPRSATAPVPTRRRHRATRPALAVAGLVALGLVIGVALGRGDDARRGATGPAPAADRPPATARGPLGATVEGLEVGDCFDQPEVGDVVLPLVPCEQLHTDEVFAVTRLDGGPGAGYPGRIDDVAERLCSNAFIDFVGAAPERSELAYNWYAPTEAEWEADARRVPCVVADPDGEPLVGSATE